MPYSKPRIKTIDKWFVPNEMDPRLLQQVARNATGTRKSNLKKYSEKHD